MKKAFKKKTISVTLCHRLASFVTNYHISKTFLIFSTQFGLIVPY